MKFTNLLGINYIYFLPSVFRSENEICIIRFSEATLSYASNSYDSSFSESSRILPLPGSSPSGCLPDSSGGPSPTGDPPASSGFYPSPSYSS